MSQQEESLGGVPTTRVPERRSVGRSATTQKGADADHQKVEKSRRAGRRLVEPKA